MLARVMPDSGRKRSSRILPYGKSSACFVVTPSSAAPLEIENFGLRAKVLEQMRVARLLSAMHGNLAFGSFKSPNTMASVGQDCTQAG